MDDHEGERRGDRAGDRDAPRRTGARRHDDRPEHQEHQRGRPRDPEQLEEARPCVVGVGETRRGDDVLGAPAGDEQLGRGEDRVERGEPDHHHGRLDRTDRQRPGRVRHRGTTRLHEPPRSEPRGQRQDHQVADPPIELQVHLEQRREHGVRIRQGDAEHDRDRHGDQQAADQRPTGATVALVVWCRHRCRGARQRPERDRDRPRRLAETARHGREPGVERPAAPFGGASERHHHRDRDQVQHHQPWADPQDQEGGQHRRPAEQHASAAPHDPAGAHQRHAQHDDRRAGGDAAGARLDRQVRQDRRDDDRGEHRRHGPADRHLRRRMPRRAQRGWSGRGRGRRGGLAHGTSVSSEGRLTLTRQPRGGWSWIWMVPPCSSTISVTMASPSPVPPAPRALSRR